MMHGYACIWMHCMHAFGGIPYVDKDFTAEVLVQQSLGYVPFTSAIGFDFCNM